MPGLDRSLVPLRKSSFEPSVDVPKFTLVQSKRPLSCRSLMKERGNTPLVDTISHFPSPGGEALNHDYKPYKPLIYEAVEVASSSPTFQHHLSTKMLEYQSTSNFVSGNVTHEELPEHFFQSQVKVPAHVIKKAALEACYKTSTQKLYEGIGLAKMVMRQKPAPIDSRFMQSLWSPSKPGGFKEKPETWQNVVSTWDRVQFRAGSLRKQLSFTSASRSTEQIPNYRGCASGEGVVDIAGEKFTCFARVRTPQPKPTDTSRKPAIPGYAGCIHAAKSSDVFGGAKHPRSATTASAHTVLEIYPNCKLGTHRRPLSQSVTLTHPYNPFNRVVTPHSQTASGCRV